ncbi:MAG: glycoside hydrolase family 57 protein [Vicinamibacterales bacterium]
MTRVAILWHMHQPYYEDLVTGEHMLPWVRLHALKDYWGMVTLLEECPGVQVTFNMVPSLLVQLEAFAAGRARDRYLDVGTTTPADQLAPDDVRFMLRNFFHAQRQRMIDVHPRYAQLLALRGWSTSESDIDAAARRFTVEDLRDLQVWQKLAWIDPVYQQRDARVRDLIARGRGFTEADKAVLREVELELLNAVIPAYRRGVESGQIEVSTSPFYHPILPLLCDTEVYAQTHPAARPPSRRFARPEDALAQLEQAAEYCERLFGRRPVGLWPSEGSVSDAMVPLVEKAGFRWMATDELILAKSLGVGFGRDGYGNVDNPHLLYRPYIVEAGGASVRCGFRDHALSDLIGFVYAGWGAEHAADDFVGKLAAAGRRAQEVAGGEEPTIFVILDGENAWEHFDGGGRPFLKALYERLAAHPELRTVTMADACGAAHHRLDHIAPGSWIDASFYIWIGHADDQRAWRLVTDAREALDDPAPGVDTHALARARQEMFIAEGSDWCWWYGDDHSSDHDAEFDELFRRHLRNVYTLIRRPIPDELFISNISTATAAVPVVQPVERISPILDGDDSSYFEWRGAGRYQAQDVAGAMHQIDHAQVLSSMRFGFDEQAIYVRLDLVSNAGAWLGRGGGFVLHFVEPAGVRIVGSMGAAHRLTLVASRRTGTGWVEVDLPGLAGAAGRIVELSIPLEPLDVPAGGRASFFVALHDADGHEVERHPTGRPVELSVVSYERFAALNWTA